MRTNRVLTRSCLRLAARTAAMIFGAALVGCAVDEPSTGMVHAAALTATIAFEIWDPQSNWSGGQWHTFTAGGFATSDGSTVTKLQWFLDGAEICASSSSSPPNNCSWFAPAGGANHQITAIATSSSGGTGQQTKNFTVDVTGVLYYVSPTGSDTNSGTSPASPWRTVAKVNATDFNGGDSVLFQAGNGISFTGCLNLTGAKIHSTPSSKFVVGAYGTGKFVLNADCTGDPSTRPAAVTISGASGIVFQDAALVGNNGGASVGVMIQNHDSMIADTITVQNADISGFYSTSTYFGSEILIDGTSGPGLTNLKFLDNTLHGASVASPDENGITGYGSNENITNVVYQGNVVYNLGAKPNGCNGCEGNGILANGVNGALMQNNIAYNIGANVNTCGGGAGFWAYQANNVVIQFNEAYAIQPTTYTSGCDWNGFDLDGYVTNSVLQYNYSHGNFGAGFLAYVDGTWGSNTIRYNISEHDARFLSSAIGPISIAGAGGVPFHVDIYNNSIYHNAGSGASQWAPVIATTGVTNASGLIANNIFYVAANAWGKGLILWVNGGDPSGLQFRNNTYYSPGTPWVHFGSYDGDLASWLSATGQDPMARIGMDPGWVSPGNNGVCGGYSTTCPAGYVLESGSAMRGAGLDLTRSPYSLNVGSQNYYGSALPNGAGTGYDIGAY